MGFYNFVQILKYQATKLGVEVVEVDRYFASSQICKNCGYKNSDVKDLKIREWILQFRSMVVDSTISYFREFAN